jgi:hypothetical protein
VPPGEPKETRSKIFAILANLLYSGGNKQLLSKLEDSGIAKFTGEYNRHNRFIILVGGAQSRTTFSPHYIDTQLITQFIAPDAIVVGCEGTKCTGSYVPVWHKAGIATVDNVDSAIGQIALVCALNGEKAQFGIKDTADRIIPQSLEKK